MARLPLGELCEQTVATFRPERTDTSSFIYIDVSAIDVSTKTIVDAKSVGIAEAPSRAQQIVRTGDILVSNVRPALNAVAEITANFDGAVCSSAFTVIRCNSKLHRDYLFCFLQSPRFIGEMETLAHGAHYPAVTDRQVLATEIELPPINEQIALSKRLLEALRDAREAIAACSEQNALGSLLRERILAEAFPDLIPLGVGPNLATAKSGWRWLRLPDIARLESGHTPSRRNPEWWGGDVPWLALTDIRKLHGMHAYETAENTNAAGLANSAARLLPAGTVCLSRTASVGFATILGKPMATSQDFCNWVCSSELDPEFLMYAFMASQDCLRELSSGAVHKTIYMPTIETFHVCTPGIDEQRRIARVLCERLAAAEAVNEDLKARHCEIERLPLRLLAAAFGSAG